MAQSETTLTLAQEIDPGLRFTAHQLQLDQAEFVPGNIHTVLPSAEFAFKSAAVIGISVGVLAGMTAIEASQGSTKEVRAEGCNVMVNGVLSWYDPCPSSAPTTTTAPVDTAPSTPPPSPPAPSTPSPSPSPNPTTSPAPRPTAPPTTINYDIDKDTYLRDQGFFPDVDDNSFGLGEQGAVEARARGIDIDSGSDEANRNLLIAYTVNPEDWEQTTSNILAVYGVVVMNPTTTTTSTTTTTIPTPPTSEAEAIPVITEAEEATESTETGANPTDSEVVENDNTTSTIEAVLAVNNSDDSGNNNNVLLPIGGILAGIGVVFGGILLARRKKQDQEEDAAGYSGTDTSPVAGN